MALKPPLHPDPYQEAPQYHHQLSWLHGKGFQNAASLCKHGKEAHRSQTGLHPQRSTESSYPLITVLQFIPFSTFH